MTTALAFRSEPVAVTIGSAQARLRFPHEAVRPARARVRRRVTADACSLGRVGAEYFTRNVSSIGTLYDRRKVSVAVLDQKIRLRSLVASSHELSCACQPAHLNIDPHIRRDHDHVRWCQSSSPGPAFSSRSWKRSPLVSFSGPPAAFRSLAGGRLLAVLTWSGKHSDGHRRTQMPSNAFQHTPKANQTPSVA